MKSLLNKLFIISLILTLVSCTQKKSEPQQQPKQTAYNNLKEGDVIEISGRLICAHCYALNKENVGIDHQLPKSGFVKDCAITCAKQNYPIAVLLNQPVDSTRLWIIRTVGNTFADFMTNTAKVKGEYVYRGLIEPTNLMVMKDKKWIKLEIKKSGMM